MTGTGRLPRALMIVGLLCAVPSLAQVPPANDQQPPTASAPAEQGRLADAGSGEIGQRLERTPDASGFLPLGRIRSRIANRIQNRMSNRIDYDYNERADAASAIRNADNQTRTAGRKRR